MEEEEMKEVDSKIVHGRKSTGNSREHSCKSQKGKSPYYGGFFLAQQLTTETTFGFV
jgi:hypothetical protein